MSVYMMFFACFDYYMERNIVSFLFCGGNLLHGKKVDVFKVNEQTY